MLQLRLFSLSLSRFASEGETDLSEHRSPGSRDCARESFANLRSIRRSNGKLANARRNLLKQTPRERRVATPNYIPRNYRSQRLGPSGFRPETFLRARLQETRLLNDREPTRNSCKWRKTTGFPSPSELGGRSPKTLKQQTPIDSRIPRDRPTLP